MIALDIPVLIFGSSLDLGGQKNRKVAHDVTHFAPKKWLTKSCNLCGKGIGQTPTIGVILKTNENLIRN